MYQYYRLGLLLTWLKWVHKDEKDCVSEKQSVFSKQISLSNERYYAFLKSCSPRIQSEANQKFIF